MTANPNNIRKIWKYAGPVQVIQKAVQQRRDKCAYAALGMHIDYNLRIAYSSVLQGGPIPLPDTPLVDYLRWEDEIKVHQGEVQNVWRLLRDAKENGVPLFNTLKVQIDEHGHFQTPLIVDDIRQKLEESTLVAVIEIRRDYSENGEKPYMGRQQIVERNGVPCKHAVVIVGEYEDNTLFKNGENVEPLWIYQNSDGDKDASFLDNGMNVVRHGLVEEVYCAETYAASLLLHQHYVPKVKPYRTKPRVNI